MNYGCPNIQCSFAHKNDFISKDGTFWRCNDSRLIQRYRCTHCKKRFSRATFSLAFKQKKRRVNHQLSKLLASGVSMRRAAIHLGIHRTTVKRKLIYLAKKARISHTDLLQNFKRHSIYNIQIDDLLTTEHTKLKPLSISLAVDKRSRCILGAEVSQIAAFGHLAQLSRRKYGQRKSHLSAGLEKMLSDLETRKIINSKAIIESDEHKLYPKFVKRYFPSAEHLTYKGEKGCVVGQGELKKIFFDPLFVINHTCAMLRANINRLIRKTWCTTKDPMMLKNHLDVFIHYYNTQILDLK